MPTQYEGCVTNCVLSSTCRGQHMSRAEMADRINASQAGVAERLACDEERIRRWESGEVRWPSPAYRRALKELTGLDPAQLGFVPRTQADTNNVAYTRIGAGGSSEACLRGSRDSMIGTSSAVTLKVRS